MTEVCHFGLQFLNLSLKRSDQAVPAAVEPLVPGERINDMQEQVEPVPFQERQELVFVKRDDYVELLRFRTRAESEDEDEPEDAGHSQELQVTTRGDDGLNRSQHAVARPAFM